METESITKKLDGMQFPFQGVMANGKWSANTGNVTVLLNTNYHSYYYEENRKKTVDTIIINPHGSS